jgi:putative sporulation protein YtxC
MWDIVSVILEVTVIKYNYLYTLSPDDDIANLADEISSVIMEEYEPKIIRRSIEKKYSFLEPWETKKIEEIALKLEKDECEAEYPPYSFREKLVHRKIDEYLSEASSVNPKGFAEFRLKEISDFAEKIAAEAADEYFAEQEYEEFTEMLSMFLSVRPKVEKKLHLVRRDGHIRLYNRFKRDVTEKYESEFTSLSSNEDDLAVSAVIAASPEELVIHRPKEDSPLENTLKKVFGERCVICNGCPFCKND